MSAFLYFVETESAQITPEELVSLGLGHIADAGNPLGGRCSAGPNGKAGLVFSVGGDRKPAFKAAEQTWKKGPQRHVKGVETGYHVGFWKDAKPGPADLKRSRFIAGERVTLRDGNEWTVPVARSFVRGTTLPRELVLGEDFETWEPRELPEFMELCKGADLAMTLFTTVNPEPEYKVIMPVVVNALAVNYRVGALELSILKLVTDEGILAVCRAICDISALEQMTTEKKTEEEAAAT